MLNTILICIGFIITAIVMYVIYYFSTRTSISLKIKRDLNKHYNLGGKWGANIRKGNYDMFIKDYSRGDRIIVYDSKVFISNHKFIPMWDNEDYSDFDFIRIIPYINTDPYPYPPDVCKAFVKFPLRIHNCYISVQQFELGGSINKDKLYPIYYISMDLDKELLAYNADNQTLYVIDNENFIKFYKMYIETKLAYGNVFFITTKNMHNDTNRYGNKGKVSWTFNMQGTRENDEIITVIPPIRLSLQLDGFEPVLNSEQMERFRKWNQSN